MFTLLHIVKYSKSFLNSKKKFARHSIHAMDISEKTLARGSSTNVFADHIH